MTLKKDIMNLLNAKYNSVQINNIARLTRWTKDAFGKDVDRMTLTFSYVCGVNGGQTFDIVSRDYDGIVNEIAECTKVYMENCTEQMIRNMRNGYR